MMEKATTYSQRSARVLLAAMLAVFALLAACAVAVPSAWAASGSITVKYTASDTGAVFPNMQVNAYKVASVQDGQYTLVSELASFPLTGWTNGKAAVTDSAEWLSAQAETLEVVVRTLANEAGFAPTAFGITDGSGSVTISNLDSGLYLVIAYGDGIERGKSHKFVSSLVELSGSGEDLGNISVEPKGVVFNPVTDVKVVKHWAGDTGSESARPQSIKVQLYCDSEKHGDVVELSDSNAWTHTWTGLDASVDHTWNVAEVDIPAGYTFSISEDKKTSTFTLTNTRKGTEVIISKQEVGGGPELPGAKLTIKDADGNVVDEWISGTTPHKVVLAPGVYTLTEVSAPNGYEIAETITFRVNEDGTTEVLQDGKWVDCANHVVMYDAPSTTTSKPPTTTTTPNPPTTTTTTVTGKLPQTGQLWWPVPVLFCAGLVAIGAGRIISTRSRAR